MRLQSRANSGVDLVPQKGRSLVASEVEYIENNYTMKVAPNRDDTEMGLS